MLEAVLPLVVDLLGGVRKALLPKSLTKRSIRGLFAIIG